MTGNKSDNTGWQKQVVAPQKVIDMIEPGMSIFLGTGVGEPRTLVKHLMAAEGANLKDLELIQLVSLADAISLKALKTNAWLNRNPLVEFQGIDKVFNPAQIGLNPRFAAVMPARKVDISGRIALHFGKGTVTAGPGDVVDLFHGAGLSTGGITIFALPSRNRNQESNNENN